MRTASDALFASGTTPTPGALLGAADELRDVTGPKIVLLISDGASTCGDPCPTAASIKDDLGADFAAVTVGFRAPDSAADELRCIAEVTGGEYFPADDEAGLAEAIGAAVGSSSAAYVAVGDSTTTGFSVPTCSEDREISPYGCVGDDPPAQPYPERVAEADDRFDDLNRVGIWGYTIADAVAAHEAGENVEGPWTPQLTAAASATELVTVSLGANDMEFSDVETWLARCVSIHQKEFLGVTYDVDINVNNESCEAAAAARVDELDDEFDALFDALSDAADGGVEIVVTKYFNPFNDTKNVRFAPDRSCALLHGIGDHVVGALNDELDRRSRQAGFTVVDLYPAFEGHGAGSSDSYVFGSDCETLGAATSIDVDFDFGWPPVSFDGDDTVTEIQVRFDPHPNDRGTEAQADAILEAL